MRVEDERHSHHVVRAFSTLDYVIPVARGGALVTILISLRPRMLRNSAKSTGPWTNLGGTLFASGDFPSGTGSSSGSSHSPNTMHLFSQTVSRSWHTAASRRSGQDVARHGG